MEKCLSLLILASALLVVVNCASLVGTTLSEKEILEKWHLFKLENSNSSSRLGSIGNRDERVKYENFKLNYMKVLAHNNEFAQKKKTFEVKLNDFATLSEQEFKSHFLGKLLPGQPEEMLNMTKPELELDLTAYTTLTSFDWRSRGIVTGVKFQGSCGSCWAFSTTGAVEAAYAKAYGTILNLSEQELIDCSTENNGCGGGYPSYGFYHTYRTGLVTENSYPYKGQNSYPSYALYHAYTTGLVAQSAYPYKGYNGYCSNVNSQRYKISGYGKVPYGNEEALKQALVTYGPVAIGMDASDYYFLYYSSGVYTSNTCSSSNLNHAVLIVGYGTDVTTGLDYWLIKNSWGYNWGMGGYAKMARNRNNMCGIATDASYPFIN